VRIALVSDWWAPRIGGIESQLVDLARTLAARGHAVRVLTTTREPTKVDGVEVEHLVTAMAGDVALPDLRRIREFSGIIAEGRHDVVHAHGMFSPLAIGSVLASARIAVPSVVTIHSLLAPWHVFAGARAIFNVFLKGATLLTGVSRAVVADVERASRRQADLIPNGLDVETWSAIEHHAPADEIRALAVLRLVPKKQPLDVVLAFDAACRAEPSLPLTLTIAGDGPMRSRIEEEVVRRRLRHRVTFAGDCSRDDIRRLMAGASIFVHPGRLEAFGLALLEARAAGVPAVAMRAGGVPEVVIDGRTGLLAADTNELGHRIAVLARDRPLRERMAAAARADLDRFSWSSVAAAYEAVYDRATQRRGMEYDGAGYARHGTSLEH